MQAKPGRLIKLRTPIFLAIFTFCRSMTNALPIAFLLLSISFPLIAQNDSSFVLTAHQNAVKQYDLSFKNQSLLYNGSEYQPPLQTNDTHPFYNSFDWQPADITYNGLVFSDVDVLCDLYRDKLVIEHFHGNQVQLISQKLAGFTVNGKKFINFTSGRLPASLPETGFYEVLHDGNMQCLIRRKKTMRRTIESHIVEVYYKEKVSYFLRKGQTYYPITSRKSLLKLLEDKRNELNHYIREQNISFKNDRDAAIAQVLQHYEELNN